MRRRYAVSGVLVGVPIVAALIGPEVARFAPTRAQAPFGPSVWAPFGTDRFGRDVLAAVLAGGRPLIVTLFVTVACAYAVGFALGTTAASTPRPWLDDLIMRPVDVLLALPSILIVIVAALRSDGSRVIVGCAVGITLVAPIARFVRMAARDVAQSPAMDALRLQGAGRTARSGYALRELARPVAADVGVRFVAALYVLAAANFLGVGFDRSSPDWAVAVAANREGLFVAPWSVYLPAAMIVSLALGINLALDQRLRGRR
ncbi:ABC transporter permease subunit [Tsukamurella sp. 8F]|uniref:ABC transporter permease n=1 Tax=unclassified Tsukamurella TaxID=2633480 RepID=UPI0023B9D786|nr:MULTISPECIES: ABC transporter permease subunit [unclassified Tsukamurella]MDF0528740.1 ABC transporter permease subunit [Tsukamurella sp. 8J]MDF0589134.1 ABC transporter permease subunit [Tsukamurella sp. 8F]